MQSLPEDSAPTDDGDSKDELRRAVEGLFNSLYGMCVHTLFNLCILCMQSYFSMLADCMAFSFCFEW